MKQQLPLFTPSAPEDVTSPSPSPSKEQLRSRRPRSVRAQTISVRRLSKRELEQGRREFPPEEHELVARPKTREECAGGVRPCPFVACVHHLYLDVSAKTGAIKLNFPDLEPWELAESCALDVAERGGDTLESVGAATNLTRERIRQIEVRALAKLEATEQLVELRAFYPEVGDGTRGKRRLPVLDGRASPPRGRDIDDRFASEELDED